MLYASRIRVVGRRSLLSRRWTELIGALLVDALLPCLLRSVFGPGTGDEPTSLNPLAGSNGRVSVLANTHGRAARRAGRSTASTGPNSRDVIATLFVGSTTPPMTLAGVNRGRFARAQSKTRLISSAARNYCSWPYGGKGPFIQCSPFGFLFPHCLCFTSGFRQMR